MLLVKLIFERNKIIISFSRIQKFKRGQYTAIELIGFVKCQHTAERTIYNCTASTLERLQSQTRPVQTVHY